MVPLGSKNPGDNGLTGKERLDANDFSYLKNSKN
jgi:hypothetical protein